jgi:hypothetical protein
MSEAEFIDLLDNVVTELDSVIMDQLREIDQEPALLYALTILQEMGLNYFNPHVDAYTYALAPDDLHPGPWSWVSTGKNEWKAYDANNTVVAEHISGSTRRKFSDYIVMALQTGGV